MDHPTKLVRFAYWGFTNLADSLVNHTPRNGDTEFSDLALSLMWDTAGSYKLQTYETPPKVLGVTLISRSQITSNPVVHLGPLLPPQPRSRALLSPLPALGTMPGTSIQAPVGQALNIQMIFWCLTFYRAQEINFAFPTLTAFVFSHPASVLDSTSVACSHTHLFTPTQKLPATSWGPQPEGPPSSCIGMNHHWRFYLCQGDHPIFQSCFNTSQVLKL